MSDLWVSFLRQPEAASFLALRDWVLGTTGYQFYSVELQEVARLHAAERHAEVLGRLPAMMPQWLLSPSLHALAASSAEALGLADRAKVQRRLAAACLRGLRVSGDGTSAAPYRVTHVDDEYDLLTSLGLTLAARRTENTPRGVCDVAVCTSGAEVYFEVSPGLGDDWS